MSGFIPPAGSGGESHNVQPIKTESLKEWILKIIDRIFTCLGLSFAVDNKAPSLRNRGSLELDFPAEITDGEIDIDQEVSNSNWNPVIQHLKNGGSLTFHQETVIARKFQDKDILNTSEVELVCLLSEHALSLKGAFTTLADTKNTNIIFHEALNNSYIQAALKYAKENTLDKEHLAQVQKKFETLNQITKPEKALIETVFDKTGTLKFEKNEFLNKFEVIENPIYEQRKTEALSHNFFVSPKALEGMQEVDRLDIQVKIKHKHWKNVHILLKKYEGSLNERGYNFISSEIFSEMILDEDSIDDDGKDLIRFLQTQNPLDKSWNVLLNPASSDSRRTSVASSRGESDLGLEVDRPKSPKGPPLLSNDELVKNIKEGRPVDFKALDKTTINNRSKEGSTPFETAIKQKRYDIAKELLENGAKPKLTDCILACNTIRLSQNKTPEMKEFIYVFINPENEELRNAIGITPVHVKEFKKIGDSFSKEIFPPSSKDTYIQEAFNSALFVDDIATASHLFNQHADKLNFESKEVEFLRTRNKKRMIIDEIKNHPKIKNTTYTEEQLIKKFTDEEITKKLTTDQKELLRNNDISPITDKGRKLLAEIDRKRK